MGFFKRLLGIDDWQNVGSQIANDDRFEDYSHMMQQKKNLENILNYSVSHEDFVKRLKEDEQKEKEKYKSPYLKRYEEFMNEAKKLGYDEELMDFIGRGPSLFKVKDLERISRLERSYIEHTGFNRDAFPEGTEILYFDEIFESAFTSQDYESKKQFIVQYVDEYLHERNIEKCCIKIGQEEFLYAYKNNIEADAIEYNFSLVDKNNNVKDKIIYEDGNTTVNNSTKLLAILQMEVEFLDLTHKKEFKNIGDIPLSTYADKKLTAADKVYIKNQILLDLFESRKYDQESLELFRECLKKDKDIGYILNPCYSAAQRKNILEIVDEYWDDDIVLKNLRKFSVETGTHFTEEFTFNQYGYILDRVGNDDIDDFNSLEKLAQMDLERYKDLALSTDSKSYEFRPEGSDKTFILTKGKEHEGYDDFRLEKVEYNEEGKKIDQYLIYEKCGENETPREGLDELFTELKKKHLDKDSRSIFENTISEVIETISDIEKHGHIHLLYAEDSSIIQIEGIRSEKKELTEDEEMAIFLGGQRNENTISEENAGITLSIIKNNEIKVLYSDDSKKEGMFKDIEDAFTYIIANHGNLLDRHDVRTMPVSVSANDTLTENIEREKTLLYKEKYKTSSQKTLEQVINLTMKKKIHSTLSSRDDAVTLLFEPYIKRIDENSLYSNCNIYKVENGEKTPVYVKTLDEKGVEHISGSFDDALDVILENDFDIRDSGTILSTTQSR